MKKLALLLLVGATLVAARVNAQFLYNNDFPTDQVATATRPESSGKFEIESADDFVFTTGAKITGATFTGLLPSGASVANVRVEIYRVFPNDSDVGRTSGPPTFSTPQVPTRVNSPSDVALLDRSGSDGNLSFTETLLSGIFTANNSVQPGGIHPLPNQATLGDGPVTGQEVQFNVTFIKPINLPGDHYFFVPQVELAGADDNFLWLSANRPVVVPGTPFPLGFTDLQSWTRDANLDPDWLRIGTDIIDGNPAGTFNAAFSLSGVVTPDSGSTAVLLGGATVALFYLRRRTGRQ